MRRQLELPINRLYVPVLVGLVLWLAIIFGISYASAADITVSWTQPSTNVDNSPIPATGAGSLASNRVEWGTCVSGAFGTKVGEKIVTPAASSTAITGLPPSTVCLRAYATNTYGSESGPSNVASKTIAPPIPQPPSITTVVQTAYMALRQDNRYVMLPVGSVPGGTQCDTTNGVIAAGKIYYAVPTSAVTWYGSTQPTVVLSSCS